MRTLFAFFTMYLTYVILAGAIIGTSTKRNRIELTVMAAVMPFLVVFAVVATLLGYVRTAEPCPGRLEEAELIVERKRLAMFGGTLIKPTIATSLQERYRVSLGKAADSFGSLIAHGHRKAA
jgi:biotin transporter BioY